MPIPIIAHRTCPLDAPENSLAGIRKAAELGADGVEIDVRRALFGAPVLMHDWSPWRTTGLPGPVGLYPYFLLSHARLQQETERVPSLDEALAALPDGLFLAMELKESSVAATALRLVQRRGLEPRVLVWSSREQAIRYVKKQAPEIETALLRDETDPASLSLMLDDALRFGARAISAHWSAITRQLVGEAHDRGLRVYSMTQDLDTVAKRVACGLDGIVTDHPREVRALLEATAAS